MAQVTLYITLDIPNAEKMSQSELRQLLFDNCLCPLESFYREAIVTAEMVTAATSPCFAPTIANAIREYEKWADIYKQAKLNWAFE